MAGWVLASASIEKQGLTSVTAGLGIGCGSIGPGYSIGDSGIGSSMIYGSTQAGNVDLDPEAMV